MKLMSNDGEIKVALLDGYRFGDRLLERVMFQIEIWAGEVICAGVKQDCETYLNGFVKSQREQWYKDACEYAISDIGDPFLETIDGDEAWIEE